MFSTKKDVDRHVKTSISKLPEQEKNLRGYAIAKLYFKIGECASAQQWLSLYLSVNEENPQAHKLLGQCYEKRKMTDKAIASYQRSFQLDSKQKNLITEICKLFLSDDTLLSNPVRAKYWCDLADSECMQNEDVLSLKLKLNKDNRVVEELLVKETIARPTDVNLRIRLLKYFLDEKKYSMAFKYCHDVTMKFNAIFMQSIDWQNTVSMVLTTYKEMSDKSVQNQWDFWLLTILTLEHQIALNLNTDTGVLSNKDANLKEISELMFEMDQLLQKASEVVIVLCSEKELASVFLCHYRGQLCLHMAAYLFKLEQVYQKNQWRDTTRKTLPLLLCAYQCGAFNLQDQWLRNSNETTRQLMYYWHRQAAFRCAQAGKCLNSCIDSANEQDVILQIRRVTDNKNWKTAEDVGAQIRQFCMDTNWRNNIFRTIFNKSENLAQIGTSYFVKSSTLTEPTSYEIPSAASLQDYHEPAQNWNPASLQHLVYLGMGDGSLVDYQCDVFKNLNISTNNLANCNAETLNQLDVDSFLLCAIIVANRVRDVEKSNYESYSDRPNDRPKILPAANMLSELGTDEQLEWWQAAYKFAKNVSLGEKATEIKSLIQYGIEAVRGVGGIKIDLILFFKLGKILAERGLRAMKQDEKRSLEVRCEEIYRHGLHFFRQRQSGTLDVGVRSLFKFSTTNFDMHRELSTMAEEAVIYLAKRYFANQKYEECIQELQDIQLPFATYFLSEAYKKLDESKKTPRKDRQLYAVKVRDYFEDTVNLLNEPLVDKNHPLKSIISSRSRRAVNDLLNTSTSNGYGVGGQSDDNNTDEFLDTSATPSRTRGSFHSARDQSFSSAAPSKTSELESLILKMMETLNIVKEDVVSIRQDVTVMQDKLVKLEEGVNSQKKQSAQHQSDIINDVAGGGGEEDFSNMYFMDDLQNEGYMNQQSQQQYGQQQMANKFSGMMMPTANNLYNQMCNTAHPMYMQYLNSPAGAVAVAAAASYRQSQQSQSGINAMQQQYSDPTMELRNNLLMTTAAHTQQYHQSMALQQQQLQQQQVPQQTTAQQQQMKYPLIEQALSNPTLLNTWNLTYNNQQLQSQQYQQPQQPTYQQPPAPIQQVPTVRTPPVNVVITQSDPLPPTPTITSAPQPTLTVTIPPHLIKHTPTTHLVSMLTNTITTPFAAPKPKTTTLFENISPASHSAVADQDSLNVSGEYDPRPDFQPIIPLPDEIEVKTGEENEHVLFTSRAKLFRFDTATKEWKEKGIGDMKILKNKVSDKIRVLMRRDQVHKICANHNITPELDLKEGQQPTTLTWVARDFSEGELKTETLCIRFKMPETAQEFKKIFNEAKETMKKLEEQENDDNHSTSSNTSTDVTVNFTFSTPKTKTPEVEKSAVVTPAAAVTTPAALPKFTGFGASPFGAALLPAPTTPASTGFSFANVTKTPVTNATDKKDEAKPSPFANFTFGKTAATVATEPVKSFNDIFSTIKTSAPSTIISATNSLISEEKKSTADTPEQSTNEDEEYVPTAQFQPVIALPDLVEVKTGEEDENCVFEHRAKLLRFDTTLKEWKERGVGNMKIMVDKRDPNKARLLMRREQVHKLCCNQRLYKDTKFTKLPKSELALSWGGPDYSESEIKFELLAIRFKTADVCQNFHEAVRATQEQMSNATTTNGTVVAEEQPKKQEEEPKGFGDQFKPKVGAWTCDGCYTNNGADVMTCLACEAPKPGTTAPVKPPAATVTSQFSFGVQPGGGGFSFGSKPAIVAEPKKVVEDKPKGFGDQFKPKAGAWACQDCYTNNTADNLYCLACESPKDATVPKKDAGFGSTASATTTASTFSFGVNTSGGTGDKPAASTFSFGVQPAAGGFSFGAAPAATVITTTTTPSTLFGAQPSSFSFGSLKSTTVTSAAAVEPVVAPTLEKNKFEFVLKPKSPTKSPVKSPATPFGSSAAATSNNDEHTDNEYHEEEENGTYFTPVIPLPDKIEVKTGEEDEETLYCHRAKLFHFIDAEWKERGIGDVKILKHRQNGKLRVLMRREKILKICLNHPLTPEVVYKPKDDKSWLFGANDFSEGYFETKQFTLRFKTPEICADFKQAVDTALIDNDGSSLNGHSHTEKDAMTTTAAVVISAEERMLAQKLKLPESFYESANNSPACRGCRGCNTDDYVFIAEPVNEDIADRTPLPLECSRIKIDRTSSGPTPSNTVSPLTAAKPLPVRNLFGSSSSENIQPPSPATIQSIFGVSPVVAKVDKENKPVDVKSTFSFLGNSGADETTRPSIFSSQQNTTAALLQQPQIPSTAQKSIFGGGASANQSLFAKPAVFAASTSQPLEGASLFSGNSFLMGGGSSNSVAPKTSSTSIFGGTGFGGTGTNQPIFGGGSSMSFGGNSSPSTFSFASAAKDLELKAASDASSAFLIAEGATTDSSSPSIFKTESSLGFGSLAAAAAATETNDLSREQPSKSPDFLNVDNSLSFASLAQKTDGEGGFLSGNQSSDTFKGFKGLTIKEDIFSKLANKSANVSDANASGGADEENYDPHYEPIINLPDEIVVKTGEEDEEKLYGERAKLFRFDQDTKEWKERGVGELKILYHPVNGSYRLLMRREQIHKLVLNHAITEDFSINMMNNSPVAYCWAAMNHAENPSTVEKLAARFKNEALANIFRENVEKCIDQLRKRAGLEPEED